MSFDTTKYWRDPPPEPSPRLALWVAKIRNGWKPNARISGMGYSERAKFFGVYLWEYFHVIYPLIREEPGVTGPPESDGHPV